MSALDATPDLSTELGPLSLPHPVMTASGCAGRGRELAGLLDIGEVAAFVTPSLRLEPTSGDPPPRVVETASGVLSATESHEPGIEDFLAGDLPWLVRRGVTTVASVAGSTLEEYGELARRLAASPGISAVEVKLSAHNDDSGGRAFGADPYHAAKATAAVRRDSTAGRPVFAKLIPDVHSVVDVATAVVEAGADGVVLIDSPRGMVIDSDTMRPAPGVGAGRLGGPAVHPLAVRCVWEVHAALPGVPLIGVGGIMSGVDVLGMLLAGASAVQVGSATLADPTAPARILSELREELERRGVSRVEEIVGRAHELQGLEGVRA
jgi:dihydroorotate dehydrogenase (NAD+) catalytic subunit